MSNANFKEFRSKDGHTSVLFSYSTLVAFHESGSKPVITAKKYSVTTTKHVSKWLRSKFGIANVDAHVVDHDEFTKLAEAVVTEKAAELFVR